MHQFTALSIAILATSALAAPAPAPSKQQKQDTPLGHFTAAIHGHKEKSHRDPLAEMKHAFGKYDWTFDVSKFDIDIPHIDIPSGPLGKGQGPPGKPQGSSGNQKLALSPLGGSLLGTSQNVELPDLLSSVGSAIGDTLHTILGGDEDDGDNYGDGEPQQPPKTTLSKVVKTTSTKAKKPKSTGATVKPVATASSAAAPPPPAYSAPAPESTSEVQATTTAAPTTSEAPVATSTPAPETTPTTSDAPSTSAYVEPTSSAPASSDAPSTSAYVEPTSSAPLSSEAGTYTPSFAFEPTTSAVPVSSAAPVSSEAPTSSAAPVSSTAPVVSSAAPAPSTTSSTYVAPTSTKQSTGGKVTATPKENESEYLSPVSVGGQSLNLNFDTGSADLWVFGSGLTDAQKVNHTAFNPSASSTWQAASGYSWSIAYGDGSSASGTVGYDTVVIGGATATKQAVEVATTVSDKFVKDAKNDGLVGLAWSSINTVKPQQQKTFFENIMPNLDLPLFTADLRDDTAVSTYEFGAIDSSKYSGDIHYTPIDNSKGHWEFSSTTYTINGQSYTNSNAAPAIADTGTSLILADQATVTAYYGAVSGASMNSQVGGYTYPCSATLPEFGVQIGSSGFTATIPGSHMTYAPLGDGNCFGGLQSNGGGNYQILGDMLFKQYFAIFNGGEKKFGVATKV